MALGSIMSNGAVVAEAMVESTSDCFQLKAQNQFRMPRRKKEEDSRTTNERQRDFLTAYADTLNLDCAAAVAKARPRTSPVPRAQYCPLVT